MTLQPRSRRALKLAALVATCIAALGGLAAVAHGEHFALLLLLPGLALAWSLGTEIGPALGIIVAIGTTWVFYFFAFYAILIFHCRYMESKDLATSSRS